MANLIRHLSRTHRVLVLVMIGGTDDPEQRRGLGELGARPFFQQFPEEAGHPEVDGLYSPIIAERILSLAKAHQIDVVQLEYTELGRYVKPLKGRVPVVLVEHDIAFRSRARRLTLLKDRSAAERVAGDREARRLREMEIAACRDADLVHVCSEVDQAFLATHLPDGTRRLRVVPNGVDTEAFRPPGSDQDRRGILFVGSFPHAPNVDALRWLLDRVWPSVRRDDPAARLTVVGARPPSWVDNLDGKDGITVAGEVEAVAPFYRDHRVMVAPIRSGSGTRLKILEAMASGIPVVSTTVGAEGLRVEDGRHLVIADDAKEFSKAVLDLLGPADGSGRKLASAARNHVAEHFGWPVVAETAMSSYAELPGLASSVRSLDVVNPGIDPRPEVSVIIHGERPLSDDFSCLEGLADQRDAPPLEIIWATHGQPDPSLVPDGRFCRLNLEQDADPGAVLNRAVDLARGGICVVLAANARPTDSLLLSRLLAPFGFPNSPAAVSGAVFASRSLDGRAFDPWFTSESRAWRERWGNTLFFSANGAFRKEVWEEFPFPHLGRLSGRRWQRQLVLALHQVQPCLDAAVRLCLDGSHSDLYHLWLDEGAGWRRLGDEYHFGHAVSDLCRCTGLMGAPRPGFPFQLAPYLRPIALWAGHRRTAD
jgi:glycosyltransferase involved in cell wall biosynthesis